MFKLGASTFSFSFFFFLIFFYFHKIIIIIGFIFLGVFEESKQLVI